MKKVKYIVLALVLCLGLIGGAYAVWTDAQTVYGTVETGNLDVNFIPVGNMPDVVMHGTYQGYVTGDANIIDGKNLEFEIDCLFPRSEDESLSRLNRGVAILRFRVKNEGCVPAKLQSATVTKTWAAGSPVWDYLYTFQDYGVYDESMVWQSGGGGSVANVLELGTALENMLDGVVIEPGETLQFDESIYFWLEHNAPNSTQDKMIKFNLGLVWQQAS